MKIIHTGDWHFREKDHDEIYKCVRFIADRAAIEQPDLIVISGDIADNRHLDFDSRSARSILEIISLMLDIAPVAVVTGTNSHDGKMALALRECRGKYPILVSDMPEQYGYVKSRDNSWVKVGIMTIDDEPDFILTQIPQPTKQYFITDLSIEDTDKAISQAMDSILASFGMVSEQFNTIPHIVNGHGQIGGAFVSETQQLIGRDIEVSKSQLLMLNADLICYGHIHKAQEMGDNIFYAGSPTRMNYGETEDKGFWIHNIDFPGSTFKDSSFFKTPAIYLHETKLDLTKESPNLEKMTDTNDIMTGINDMCELLIEDHDNWGCKITVTAWQDESKTISKTEIEKLLNDYGSQKTIVNIVRKPRDIVRSKAVLDAESLPDKIKAMAELRGEDVSDSVLDKAASLEAGERFEWTDKAFVKKP
jgi:DNA repair exonuclease SbcCD nuclease subunit